MSEEYKLSNVTCGLDDTNYAICLEGEHLGYNKKALQEVADKANSHDKLTQQVAELRAALLSIKNRQQVLTPSGFEFSSVWQVANKALKESE